jgi:indolepyruvate ferredoxin oxidoreductase alpha subunit
MKKTQLLMGDEALALAAIDAGVKAFYGYPGTPSTEIFESGENLIKMMNDGRVAEWAANEKVAYEFALGASYAGYRTVVTMKHVGLNVAFDAFVNSALTGVQGGLVLAIADDPSMHSSQNEQDTRVLTDFAHLPLLEPSTPQETYEMTIKAFELSEKLKLPVVLRLVTRLAHSRGEVTPREETLEPTCLGVPSDEHKNDWVLIPAIARHRYRDLRKKLPALISEASEYNALKNVDSKIGVVLAGMGRAYFHQYVRDNNISENTYNTLEIGAYPIDINSVKDFIAKNEKIYVFEEDYPYIEDMFIPLAENKAEIHGRRDETLTIDGELDVSILRGVLENKQSESIVTKELSEKISDVLESRPPILCDGCGHGDAFNAIKSALKNIGKEDTRIFGDIGCYTLGVQDPYNAINTTVEMGASLSMAFGAAKVGYTPSIGIIGDSTFFHSGMPTLLSAAKSNVNVNLVILDNAIVGMTGQQYPVAADIAPTIAEATGFKEEQIHVLNPLPKETENNTKILEEVFAKDEPSLIIFKRHCVQAMRKKLYKK